MAATKITPTHNGPLRVEGDFEIVDPWRKTFRARRPDEGLALPLRPLRQQALLRRHPQGRWVYRRSPRPRSASAGTARAETVTPRERFNASP